MPRTLDEIGQVYGVTRERIRQIESKTMSKLALEPVEVAAPASTGLWGHAQSDEQAKRVIARVQSMIKHASEMFTGINFDDREDEWVGSRPVTPDGLPHMPWPPAT